MLTPFGQSVPPIWQVLQTMRVWLGKKIMDDDQANEKAIGDRLPWWELMVEELVRTAGIMCVL